MLPITLPLQFGNASRLFGNPFPRYEQRQSDKLRELPAKSDRLRLVQFAPHRSVDRFRLQWLHAALHNSARPSAQVYLS